MKLNLVSQKALNFTRVSKTALAIACGTIMVTGTSVAAQDASASAPEYMRIITTNSKVSPKESVAFNNIYQLNNSMFEIYDAHIALYRQHIKERIPLIMGLFSGKGGRFILYRPGHEPLEAESPPIIYQMAKSVGHCAMATWDLCGPYVCTSQEDKSWLGPMKAYRVRIQTAMDSLDDVNLKSEERELLRDTLKLIADFQDKCLSKNSFSFDELDAYAKGIKPNLVKLIGIAASNQVAHWWKVLEEWKKLLGPDWEKTYALSNSIYVARQNNILFSVLANFMGEKAINDRLILLETTDFTAKPEDMLDAFTRIISDRALGMSFYKNYHLMDYELLGGGGRAAIIAEAEKRGQKPLLPPLVPFNSNQWPMRIDAASGTGPSTLDEIH